MRIGTVQKRWKRLIIVDRTAWRVLDRVGSRPGLSRWIGATAWAYAGFLVVLVGGLYTLGDRWWPTLLVLFGPRWIWGMPLLVLIPTVLWRSRRSIGVIIVSAWLFLGPLSGLCIPISWGGNRDKARAERLRVMTCNVHYANLDTDRLGRLISATAPDFVALQEWSHEYSLRQVFSRAGWYIATRQNICFASRYPIREVEVLLLSEHGSNRERACRCLIQTPAGDFQFFNLMLLSPSDSLRAIGVHPERLGHELQENIEVRRVQSELVSRWAEAFPGPKLLAGDFNLPVESAIYRRYWSRYSDAFSVVGWGLGHTRFTSWHGVRIDHILVGPGWQVERCEVGPDVGSDHRPVIADLLLLGE
jgi:vancomycin resistance protein VanJ